jgi:hypothetical protein
MAKIPIGIIKGPQGDAGPTGPPGSSGANALFDGTTYNIQPGAVNYVGTQDPVISAGSVQDGSIWFDTA